MGTKLLFLGTAAACTLVTKHNRVPAGIVVQSDNLQLHLDPGPGALLRAAQYGVNVRQTTALLLSSANLARTGDLNAMIDALTYSGFDRTGVVITNGTIINGDEQHSPVLRKQQCQYVERVITVKPKQKVGIENVEIEVIPAKNEDTQAIGFKLFTPHNVICYTGDTNYSVDLLPYYRNVDILILNISGMSNEEVTKIATSVTPGLLVLTGFDLEQAKENPLYIAREVQKDTNVQTIAAKDGMILNPESFYARIKQHFSKDKPELEEYKEEVVEEVPEPESPVREVDDLLE